MVGDGAHASIKRQDHGVLYLSSRNFKDSGIDLSKVYYISEDSYEKYFKVSEKAITRPKPNDVVLSIIGSMGEPYVVLDNDKFGLSSSVAILRPNLDKVYPKFLFYWIKGPEFQNALHNIKGGAAQSYVSLEMIRSLPFNQYSLDYQKQIASILSTYDDLIENNNRRIAILEEIARSLYKEWFVKFRFPGHEEVKMVDSELGQMPEGWRVVKLFDTASPTYGYAFKSSLFNDKEEGTPVVRIRDILKNISNTFTPEHPKKQDQILKNGDLLIGMDGDFHMGKWAGGHAYLNQRVVKITPKEGYSAYFTFLSMEKSIKELNVSIVGTTVAHLGDSHLKEIQIILPEEKIRLKANAILDLLFKQEINLRVRNQNLKTQRNMLLPKLISGKLSVT